MLKNLFQNKYEYIISIVVFIIYSITLAPSVVQIDSGELAAVQATLGIAHPTGYPLFTILGYLYLLFPLPFTTILSLNILAAIYCSFAILFFTNSLKLLIKELWKDLKSINSVVVIITSAILLATSKTFWEQSSSVEVYSLHLLLINLTILILLKAYFSGNKKEWFLLSISLALCFTNHMSSLFLIPGITILYFSKMKFSTSSFALLLKMFILFFLVLVAVYSYLPLRAAANPFLNWGNPENLENLLRHITGKQYQTWLFSSFGVAKEQLSRYINSLPSEFEIVSLLFFFWGIYAAFLKNKIIFTFLIINFLFTIIYAINYDIHDIDAYFLLSYVSISTLILFGLADIFHRYKKISYLTWITFSMVIIVLQFIQNYNEVDRSDLYTFEDYTKNILENVDDNSLIISYQWDYFVSPSYYFQYVDTYRPDVIIIDKELLRRSWYYNQLEKNHPEVLQHLNNEINTFLLNVKPFEKNETYNSALLEESYRRIINQLIAKNLPNRSVYLGPEIVENELRKGKLAIPYGYIVVPHHYLYKIQKESEYCEMNGEYTNIRFPQRLNVYTKFIRNIIYTMLANRVLYELMNKKLSRAKKYIREMKKFDPNRPLPQQLLNYY